jgi:hypothetical protein
MFFVMEARSELERRAGGPIVQNLDRDYTLTAAERAYLMGLGVPSIVIDGWLAQMNNQRFVEAPKFSRNYLEHYANYSGKIKHPVLTMHTVIDPLVVVAQEHEYAETVANAGRGRCAQADLHKWEWPLRVHRTPVVDGGRCDTFVGGDRSETDGRCLPCSDRFCPRVCSAADESAVR